MLGSGTDNNVEGEYAIVLRYSESGDFLWSKVWWYERVKTSPGGGVLLPNGNLLFSVNTQHPTKDVWPRAYLTEITPDGVIAREKALGSDRMKLSADPVMLDEAGNVWVIGSAPSNAYIPFIACIDGSLESALWVRHLTEFIRESDEWQTLPSPSGGIYVTHSRPDPDGPYENYSALSTVDTLGNITSWTFIQETRFDELYGMDIGPDGKLWIVGCSKDNQNSFEPYTAFWVDLPLYL